jgi:3-(3-hydroxy-phenyl)propionate hydroxylase
MIYDVVIIGCGPVGAVAANLLGQAGHRVLILDQFVDVFTLPRAVHLDHEMLRIFQGLGLDADLLPLMREAEGHMHLGADGDVIRFMGSSGKPRPFLWANDYFFYQPELEAVLRAGFRRFSCVDFRQGVRVEGLRNVEGGCEVMAGDEVITSRFVIACDGARSPSRQALSVSMDDLGFEEAWLVVDANVEGPISFAPIKSLPEDANPQHLSVMICDPRRPTTIVPGRGAHRRWEFMLLPGESETEIVEPDAIAGLVGPWLEGCAYNIVRTATYRFNARIAEAWRVGKAFLAGDAAHQTPPFFGQGMCHGVRDVANLSFKLDLVLRGLADEGLLDTYQSEREAQVRHIIGAAVAAGRYICELDPERARLRDEDLRRRAREGADIATAGDLIAPYGRGLVAPGGGERFIQPMVVSRGKRMRLDDALGRGFALITRSAEPTPPQIADLGVALFKVDEDSDPSGELARKLDHHQAESVLLRPDRYVYGWAGRGEMSRLFDRLAAQLSSHIQKAELHA